MIFSVMKYQAVTDHLSCELQGESVILNMKNGRYYGINTVGSSIWAAIQNPSSFEDIRSAILNEYDVTEDVCQREIKTFLDKMVQEELVITFDEAAC